MADIRVRSIEETEVHIASLVNRVQALEQSVSGHAQRFELQGWPWYDLSAKSQSCSWRHLP